MSAASTLTSENQTTIPKAIVEALHLKPGTTFSFEVESDGSIRLTPKTKTFKELAGSFGPKPPKVVSSVDIEEMNEAIELEAAERFQRSSL